MSWRERATPVAVNTAAPATPNTTNGWRARATPVKAEQQHLPQDKYRTVFDQGMQGATFGFADEPMDFVGTAIATGSDLFRSDENKLYKDKSFGDVYDEARGMTKERLEQQWQQHPVISGLSQLGGTIATGVATAVPKAFMGAAATTGIRGAVNAIPKAGGAVLNSLRTGEILGKNLGTAGRIIKGAAAGATSGGLYGAGAADDGHRLEGVGRGALYGAGFGAALPAAGATLSATGKGIKTAGKGMVARSGETLQDAAEGMKPGVDALYKQMRDAGAVLTPNATKQFVSDITTAISKQKFISGLNPKTTAVLDDLEAAAAKGNIGVDELDQWRRLFARVGGSEDGYSAGSARQAIDNALNGLSGKDLVNGGQHAVKLLQQARSAAAKRFKFEDVTDIVANAGGDPNKIKSALTRFLNNRDNLKGFTGDEITDLRKAASSTSPEKVLGWLGKFGISKNITGSAIGSVLGGAAAGGPGAAGLVGAGTIARQGQKYLARGKAENLLQTIERGGVNARPTGKAISPLLSAPAGAAGGALTGGQNTAPAIPKYPTQITIPNPKQQLKPLPQQRSDASQPDFLKRLAQVESSNNPNAKAKTSSAQGLYQFTDKTWRDMVQKYGQKHGVTMKDRNNPEKSGVMANLLKQENGTILKNRLNRNPSEPELYIAHFLGGSNAARLLKNKDNHKIVAASMFPEAAKANRKIFYDGSRARKPAEVIALLSDKFKNAKIDT